MVQLNGVEARVLGALIRERDQDAGVLSAEFECCGECVQSEEQPRAGDGVGEAEVRTRCLRWIRWGW